MCESVLYSMDISIDESDNKDQSINQSIYPEYDSTTTTLCSLFNSQQLLDTHCHRFVGIGCYFIFSDGCEG